MFHFQASIVRDLLFPGSCTCFSFCRRRSRGFLQGPVHAGQALLGYHCCLQESGEWHKAVLPAELLGLFIRYFS